MVKFKIGMFILSITAISNAFAYHLNDSGELTITLGPNYPSSMAEAQPYHPEKEQGAYFNNVSNKNDIKHSEAEQVKSTEQYVQKNTLHTKHNVM